MHHGGHFTSDTPELLPTSLLLGNAKSILFIRGMPGSLQRTWSAVLRSTASLTPGHSRSTPDPVFKGSRMSCREDGSGKKQCVCCIFFKRVGLTSMVFSGSHRQGSANSWFNDRSYLSWRRQDNGLGGHRKHRISSCLHVHREYSQ